MLSFWQYIRKIFDKWLSASLTIWTALSSADTLVSHYASEPFKRSWDTAWLAPKLGWKVWLLGTLFILLVFVFYQSWQLVKSLSDSLDLALMKPIGPELVLDSDGLYFMVRNLRGGTAHDITIHRFANHIVACEEYKIGYIPEGQLVKYRPTIKGKSGNVYTNEDRWRLFLEAAYNSNPPLLPKIQDTVLRVKVTYSDGLSKSYIDDFEMRYSFATKRLDFNRLSHTAKPSQQRESAP